MAPTRNRPHPSQSSIDSNSVRELRVTYFREPWIAARVWEMLSYMSSIHALAGTQTTSWEECFGSTYAARHTNCNAQAIVHETAYGIPRAVSPQRLLTTPPCAPLCSPLRLRRCLCRLLTPIASPTTAFAHMTVKDMAHCQTYPPRLWRTWQTHSARPTVCKT